jgi:hypothetical protein
MGLNALDYFPSEWWPARRGDPYLQHIMLFLDALGDTETESEAQRLHDDLLGYELTTLARWLALEPRRGAGGER